MTVTESTVEIIQQAALIVHPYSSMVSRSPQPSQLMCTYQLGVFGNKTRSVEITMGVIAGLNRDSITGLSAG